MTPIQIWAMIDVTIVALCLVAMVVLYIVMVKNDKL